MTCSADNVERVVDQYGDTLYRLCLAMLQNASDAEDAVQETVLKYIQRAPVFSDAGHERAWLITVAKNQCRDMLRARRRHPQVELTEAVEIPAPDNGGALDTLMAVPEKYRLVLILHYVEQYSVRDIAQIIKRTPSAVKMRLQKGRKMFEELYRKERM